MLTKRKTGPKPKLSREDAKRMVEEYNKNEKPVEAILEDFSISKSTFYKELRRAA